MFLQWWSFPPSFLFPSRATVFLTYSLEALGYYFGVFPLTWKRKDRQELECEDCASTYWDISWQFFSPILWAFVIKKTLCIFQNGSSFPAPTETWDLSWDFHFEHLVGFLEIKLTKVLSVGPQLQSQIVSHSHTNPDSAISNWSNWLNVPTNL